MVARRSVVKTLATLPLATVLADATLAKAAAEKTTVVSMAIGDDIMTGALALPATPPAGAVLLIHEWWGLNDQIRVMANEFAAAGYVALACDLYGGSVAKTPDEARAMTKAIDADKATQTLVGWIDWLRQHEAGNGKVGTVGWCFGGGWSLNASLATPVDATVVYYGRVNKDAATLASLKSPVLGHFGSKDKFINEEMVTGFEQAMIEADKPFTTHWYSADHAFANPTTARYDEEDASVAWSRTLDFLADNLRV